MVLGAQHIVNHGFNTPKHTVDTILGLGHIPPDAVGHANDPLPCRIPTSETLMTFPYCNYKMTASEIDYHGLDALCACT